LGRLLCQHDAAGQQQRPSKIKGFFKIHDRESPSG
jgi:hypothetical protein